MSATVGSQLGSHRGMGLGDDSTAVALALDAMCYGPANSGGGNCLMPMMLCRSCNEHAYAARVARCTAQSLSLPGPKSYT